MRTLTSRDIQQRTFGPTILLINSSASAGTYAIIWTSEAGDELLQHDHGIFALLAAVTLSLRRIPSALHNIFLSLFLPDNKMTHPEKQNSPGK
jgi:hypothetical protein